MNIAMQIVTSIILHAVEHIIGSGGMRTITDLVEAEMDSSLPGEEKRVKVQGQIESLREQGKLSLADTASWAINIAIESAVAYLKART